MADMADTETGPDGSPRDHWTHTTTKSGSRWSRHTFPVGITGELGQHMADGTTCCTTTIVTDDGKTLGVVVPVDQYNGMRGIAADFRRCRDEKNLLGLRPAVHGPRSNTTDGLLIERGPIKECLARYAKTRNAELSDDDLTALSIAIAIETVLPVDDEGRVPVRKWRDHPDGTRTAIWGLGWPTSHPGLFIEQQDDSIFGEPTYGVITGAGFLTRGGFLSKEIAEGFAEAIIRVAPGVDWRVMTTPVNQWPAEIRKPLIAVARRWAAWGETSGE